MSAESWNVEAELASLRWRANMVVVNHFGERVWLKPLFDAKGRLLGITDCCLENEPCSRHAAIVFQHLKEKS